MPARQEEIPDGASGTDDSPAPGGDDTQTLQPPAVPPPAEPESEADRLLRELEETPAATSDVPGAPDRDAPAQDFDTEKDPDIFGDN